MKLKSFLPLLLPLMATALAWPETGHTQAARNKDGSIVTGVIRPAFDPTAGLDGLPIPSNLFFLGSTDLTLNAPTEGLDGTAAALVDQINSLDGFSTTERWTVTFLDNDDGPGMVDPASVIPGQSVRVFQVNSLNGNPAAVASIQRELTPGLEYTAAAVGNVVFVIPLQPLAEYTNYMAVLTNDITDMAGNNATPDQFYFLTQADVPWVDEQGRSTYPLLDDATAQGAEALRQLTATMEGAAATQGINPDDVVLSFTVQTQSVQPVLQVARSLVQPAPVVMQPISGNTAALGLAGLADFAVGTITLPYYLGIPSEENPVAPLTDFWTAAPGAYLPPFDALGLDPNSTNITQFNPIPVLTGLQTVPVIVSVPSGMERPAGGWPVVIYGHGLGRNRTDSLVVADAYAAAGFATVAIDFPLHGVGPDSPFYVGAIPGVNERTFDLDVDQDGIPDPSGAYALNFQEFRTSRDNLRQGVIDLSTLANSLGNFDLDQDGVGDLRPFDVGYGGQSWGGINGTVFAALEPLVNKAYLNVPAGGLVRAGEASPNFGPTIRAGLEQAGIFPGDALFELYLTVGQSVADSGDPINWITTAAGAKPVLLQEVIGDTVLPNFVPGVPLSGTEPLIRVGGLTAFDSTQVNPEGLRAASRFVPPATHGSLLDPSGSLAATLEMLQQTATFLASEGTFIEVGDASTLVPVMVPEQIQPRAPIGIKAPGKGAPLDRLESTETGPAAIGLEPAPATPLIPGFDQPLPIARDGELLD